MSGHVPAAHRPATSKDKPGSMMNGHSDSHTVGIHNVSSPVKVKVKYRLGINMIAFLQFMLGLVMLNFEAISSVLYRMPEKDFLNGVENLGMVVGISCMVTSIIGRLSTRRSGPRGLRMCFHVCNIIFTTFLSVESFAMTCISAALLALYTISWDRILAIVNRVSQSAQLNLSLGTTTTTSSSVSLAPAVAAEIKQDFNLLVGIRCILFAMYLVIFIFSIVSSCFSCCNYCKCWVNMTNDDRRFSHAETHIHAHPPAGHVQHHHEQHHHHHSTSTHAPPVHARAPAVKSRQTTVEPKIAPTKTTVEIKTVTSKKSLEKV